MKFGSPLKMIEESEKDRSPHQSTNTDTSLIGMVGKDANCVKFNEIEEKDGLAVSAYKEASHKQVIQRKKARVGGNFKEKTFKAREIVLKKLPDTLSLPFSDDEYDIAAEEFKRELLKRESYFLRKIQLYKRDFEAEKAAISSVECGSCERNVNELQQLEKELEESRISQLNLLMKVKEMKSRILELEAKNLFYKNRLKKYEGSKAED